MFFVLTILIIEFIIIRIKHQSLYSKRYQRINNNSLHMVPVDSIYLLYNTWLDRTRRPIFNAHVKNRQLVLSASPTLYVSINCLGKPYIYMYRIHIYIFYLYKRVVVIWISLFNLITYQVNQIWGKHFLSQKGFLLAYFFW